MKRLLLLSIVTMFAVSATGCLWNRPWFNRGAPCGQQQPDPCAGGHAAYSGGPGYDAYESTYAPGVTTSPGILPGPSRNILPPG